MTSRSYCFTLNNPSNLVDFSTSEKVRYAVSQLEIGASGTVHLQGYIELHEPIRYTALIKDIPDLKGAHFEKRYGTRDQARNYCMKQDETYLEGPWEYGEWNPNGQGCRNDIYDVKDMIDKGLYYAVPDEHFAIWCQYRNSFDAYAALKSDIVVPKYTIDQFNRSPMDLSKPVLLTGSSGTGKTSYALAHFKKPFLVKDIDDLKRLTGEYDGIVFDDMSFKHWPAESVIHLLDWDTSSSIRCRNFNGRIPAQMRRIFTHNDQDIFACQTSLSQVSAIQRRYVTVDIGSQNLYNVSQ